MNRAYANYEVIYLDDPDNDNLGPGQPPNPTFRHKHDAVKCADYWNAHDGATADDPRYGVVRIATNKVIYP